MRYDPAYPFLDRQLNTLRAAGVGLSLALACAAALLWSTALRPVGLLLAVAAAALLFLHLLAAWIAPAWIGAEAAWALASLALAVVLVPAGWPAAGLLTPLGAFTWMLAHRRSMLARLRGQPVPDFGFARSEVPKWAPCVWCGSRDSEVVAPLWCVSALYFTMRWPGRFRGLCLSHARVVAIPASLFSFLFGWWGLPWGPIWTSQSIASNLSEGGATLNSGVLAELRERQATEGGIDHQSAVADFGIGVVLGVLPLIAVYFALRPR